MQPEYVTIPLPKGITDYNRAIDWLEEFGEQIIEAERRKLNFKYWKPYSFNYSVDSTPALTLSLIYSNKPSKVIHL